MNNKQLNSNLFYFVTIESYDCFTGYRSETKEFQTLLDAWKFYKSISKFDFDYMDHYQATNKPRRAKDADAYVLPKQRPHARSKEEYESWFAPYKCEPFFSFKQVSNFNDVKDVEVIKEKEYFFDNDEILF